MFVLPSVDRCRALLAMHEIKNPSLVITAPDGTTVTIDAERATYPASMIKVPLAVAACRKYARTTAPEKIPAVHAGQFTVNDAPSQFTVGYIPQLPELLEAMVARSDNTATNVLLDYVGRQTATRDIQQLGCSKTSLRRYVSGADPRLADPLADGENEHPACDAARLFALLAEGIPHCEPVVTALEQQLWNDKLTAGLSSGDTFAHKTGDTQTVSHDGGILRLAGGTHLIIVLYSTLSANVATDANFARFMRSLRAEFVNEVKIE